MDAHVANVVKFSSGPGERPGADLRDRFGFTASEAAVLTANPERRRIVNELAELIRPEALREWMLESDKAFGTTAFTLIADDDFEPLEQMLYEFREGAYL